MDSTENLENKPELEQLIRHQIEEKGGITFAEYMAQCLYHPQYGYYMDSRQRIGKEGDFFTSSSVHPLFGRLVARQLFQMWELLGKGDFTVAEQGAGGGHFCLDIMEAVAEEYPDFYRKLTYCLVEISPSSRDAQEKLLVKHKDRISWCGFDELTDIEGCFLTNELVDAFPVHMVEKREGEFKEVYVVVRDNQIAEELRPLSSPRILEHFRTIGVEPVEGCRAEVNLEADEWIAKVGKLLRRGFVITIDYGYPAKELYAPFRQAGTLMCYHRHRSNENPYQNIGCQDITAHIDFTALEEVGKGEQLQPLYLGMQYQFLMGLGFLETMVEMEARETDPKKARALRLSLKNLILPEGGMGETFKVLVQGKGVGTPELLCARKLNDIPVPMPGF